MPGPSPDALRVAIRADASPAIGGGHVWRCLSLVRALAARGARVHLFATEGTTDHVPAFRQPGAPTSLGLTGVHLLDRSTWNDPDALLAALHTVEATPGSDRSVIDLLVVDHYGLDAAYVAPLRATTRRVLALDDLADRPLDADAVLDQTLGRDRADVAPWVGPATRLWLGPRWAPLRPSFAEHRPAALARPTERPLRRLLVSVGTGDPHDLTGRILDGVTRFLDGAGADGAGGELAVDVVAGRSWPGRDGLRRRCAAHDGWTLHLDVGDEMAARMAEADLAVGAGGTTSWERCTVGLPTLLLVLADNQQLIAQRLADAGAARVVWRIGEGDLIAAIAHALEAAAHDPAGLAHARRAAAAVCDGRGAERVADALLDLLSTPESP